MMLDENTNFGFADGSDGGGVQEALAISSPANSSPVRPKSKAVPPACIQIRSHVSNPDAHLTPMT
jgi:hypothetical protein